MRVLRRPAQSAMPVEQRADVPGEDDDRDQHDAEHDEYARGCRGRGRRATGRGRRPWLPSDFPPPNTMASGPAMAKKATVAMNVISVDVSRNRHRDAEAPHGVDHHRRGTRLERRQVRGPRAHAAGEHHPAQRRIGMHHTGNDPEAEPAADPVHRREQEADEQPGPVQVQQLVEHRLGILAVDERHGKTDERDQEEDLEPATDQLGREESGGHAGRKRSGLRPPADSSRDPKLSRRPGAHYPSLRHAGRHPHRQRTPAQPAGRHRGPAPPRR